MAKMGWITIMALRSLHHSTIGRRNKRLTGFILLVTVIPANSNGGRHYAQPQWVHFITGLAHITLPKSSDEAWVIGGKYGLLWAGDMRDVSKHGHNTFYQEESTTLALMTVGGAEPEHIVVREGGCLAEDLRGYGQLGDKKWLDGGIRN